MIATQVLDLRPQNQLRVTPIGQGTVVFIRADPRNPRSHHLDNATKLRPAQQHHRIQDRLDDEREHGHDLLPDLHLRQTEVI